MPTRYTQFGEFFMQGLATTLAQGTPIEVPHVGQCTIRSVLGPRMHHSNWSMQVSITFPNSHSELTVGLYTFGSCLMDDTDAIPLPEPTYEDEQDKIYPSEHQDAWYRLLDALEAELEAAGFTVGSSDESDFYLITDYMPSDGISCSVLKPSLITQELIDRCQRLTRTEATWKLWIRLGFDFVDKRHKGHNENVLVRPDRVAHDYDASRLQSEFPNEVPFLRARGDA